ncbi:MAG TPA: phosphatidylglycerophosphatase A [Coxiellaceae bacterium]|nr:phosphatidylglycerophosphatase A [Coxiellaceae bacterium]
MNTHSIWTNPIHFFASGFGAGAMPFAPGTFGTLMAIPFVLVLAQFSLWMYVILTAFYILLAIRACDITAKDWGVDDPGATASDEIAGFLVTMLAVKPTAGALLIGFGLFRILDIWKPFPIRWFDRHIHGGLGIVLDDLVAGGIACVLLHLLSLQFQL